MITLQDKFRGCIAASWVGSAMGAPVEGWLPDRVSIGALTKTFPPELVDHVVEMTDTREVRRRLLPARLMVYFVLALWLFRGRNCGYP